MIDLGVELADYGTPPASPPAFTVFDLHHMRRPWSPQRIPLTDVQDGPK